MKYLQSLLLSAIVSFGLSHSATAADLFSNDLSATGVGSWYLRGDVGWSFLDWSGGSDDDAITFGAGVGYQYNTYLRTDLRIDYSGGYSVGGGAELDALTALANFYLDVPVSEQLTPYVGVGAGYGWADVDPGSDDSGFSYALMAGAGFDMTRTLMLDVGYRYREIDISGPNVADHSFLAGFRFTF